jgi:exonuclease III
MDRDHHCNVLKELVTENSCNIVCIQETKLQQVDDMFISSTLGQKFLGQYAALPAEGTREGIILACSQDLYSISQVNIRQFSVSANITRRLDNVVWSITVVYGLQSEADKLSFMQEIRQISQTVHDRWLLLGDFNLIYRAYGKSSGNINKRLMNSF